MTVKNSHALTISFFNERVKSKNEGDWVGFQRLNKSLSSC